MQKLRVLSPKMVLTISFMFSFFAAIYSVGFYHPDEQYYAIDFAAFKLGLIEKLNSWEFDTELRPWSLPFLFYPFLALFKLMGLNPFTMATLLRLISGVFSWATLGYFGLSLKDRFNTATGYRVFFIFLHLAFFMKLMQVRTSSENWSTGFILLSLVPLLKNPTEKKNILLAALFGGLAFLFRHQLGFVVLSLGLYLLFIKKVPLKNWIPLFCGPLLVVFGVELLIDSWGYGHISFSPWNYVYQNIILDKVSQFGTHPVYSYVKWGITKLGPFGALMPGGWLYFLGKRPKNIFTWATTLFILVHHFIGHKELRFLYPVAPMLMFMGFSVLDDHNYYKAIWFRITVMVFAVLNAFALLFVTFKPAYTPLTFYEALHDYDVADLKVVPYENRPLPALELKFYRPQDVDLIPIRTHLELAEGHIFTTAYHELEVLLKRKDCELLFSSYPKWLLNYNIGGWRERSNIWALTYCPSP